MDNFPAEEKDMTARLQKREWRDIVSPVITALVLLLFVYVLYQQWQTGQFRELKYPVAPFLLSALGMFGLAVLLGFLWCRILGQISGRKTKVRPLLYAHFISWLARYTPGKIAQIASKIMLGESIGYRRGTLIASTFYENVFFIGSGISAVMLCLGPAFLKSALSSELSERWIVIFAVVVVAGMLLFSYLLPAMARHFFRDKAAGDWAISAKSTMSLFVAYHFTHVAAGAGFYFLLTALVPQNSVTLAEAIGILTAAHIGGILAFIVPAGLGVRESILALLLSSYMPMDQAVLVSLITRVWSTVADGYVLISVPFIKFARKGIGA